MAKITSAVHLLHTKTEMHRQNGITKSTTTTVRKKLGKLLNTIDK